MVVIKKVDGVFLGQAAFLGQRPPGWVRHSGDTMGLLFQTLAAIIEKILNLLNNPNHYPYPPTFILSAPPRLCVRIFPLGVLASWRLNPFSSERASGTIYKQGTKGAPHAPSPRPGRHTQRRIHPHLRCQTPEMAS